MRPKTHELLAARLRDDLAGGVWLRAFPGVRELMRYYGVSAPPVHAALEILELEGWVGASHSGKRRQILCGRKLSQESAYLLCRPPLEEMTALTAKIHRLLTQEWQNHGVRWRTVVRKEARPQESIEEMRAMMTGPTRILGVVGLDGRHLELREAIGTEMPLLMLGAKVAPDDRCAAVRLSLAEVVPQSLRYLFGRGVEGVTVLPAKLHRSTYDNLLPCVAQVYREHGLPFVAERQFPWVEPGQLTAVLRTLSKAGGLRVLVTINETIWARVLWEIQHMNAQVEVLALWSSSILADFENPPCLCEVRFEDYLKATMDWCREVQLGRAPSFDRDVSVKGVWQRK